MLLVQLRAVELRAAHLEGRQLGLQVSPALERQRSTTVSREVRRLIGAGSLCSCCQAEYK